MTSSGERDKIVAHIPSDEEEKGHGMRQARERRCEVPASSVVGSPPSCRLNGMCPVGLPDAHRYRGQGMDVPGERAQARNLGGTAKQPFALNEGGRLFFTARDTVQRAPDGLIL